MGPGDGPSKGSRMVRQRTSDPFCPKSVLNPRPFGLPIHIILHIDMRYGFFSMRSGWNSEIKFNNGLVVVEGPLLHIDERTRMKWTPSRSTGMKAGRFS